MSPYQKPILLVALGGNALIQKGQRGTVREQFENLALPLGQVARLSQHYRIILTHGNGPQVGDLLLQQECCTDLPRLPLEILVAQTEGQIGYMIESTLDSELMAIGIHHKPLVTLITYVVVDPEDPSFRTPTKPVGPVYPEEDITDLPFPVVQADGGFRRVVASPEPITIIEKREIQKLVDADFIVICCGGGGIPVIRQGRAFNGVDAVIDKDLASGKLAAEVGADIFLIATDVKGVTLNHGSKNERFLSNMTVAEANRFADIGQFPPGSMGPKVKAAADFTQATGRRSIITGIDAIEAAVVDREGTSFTL